MVPPLSPRRSAASLGYSQCRRTFDVLRAVALIVMAAGCATTQRGPPQPARVSMQVLLVPGFGDARVVPPRDDGRAKPLLVALHGSWDRPEWICEQVGKAVAGRAWVLCPRGLRRRETPPDGPRWTLGKPAETLRELTAAVAQLRRTADRRIASGPVLLAGFSKGAYQAGWLASREPKRFPRVLLHEGGHSSLRGRRMTRFVRSGGERVAYGCGTPSCARKAQRACGRLRKAGLACEIVIDLRVGHSYNPPFEERGADLFEWLLAPGERERL